MQPREAAPATPVASAQAIEDLLPYGAADYRYLVIGHGDTPPVGFEQPGFDDSLWLEGAAGFGQNATTFGCPLDGTVQTTWPVDTELLARKSITVPAGATNLRVFIAVDNDINGVWFNGTLIQEPVPYAGCAALDSFTIPVPQNLVQVGTNIISYHVSDLGQISYFNSRVSADTSCGDCTELLSPQALDYRYVVLNVGPPPLGFEQPGFDDSLWGVGAAGFGQDSFPPAFCPLQSTIQTVWPTHTSLLVRKSINVPSGATNLRVFIAADDFLDGVWFNGTLLGSGEQGACVDLTGFSFPVPQNLVQTGSNLLAYHVRDTGDESFFDTKVVANVGTAQFCLTTNSNPSSGGSVSPANTTCYDSGTQVQITATPNPGFIFSGWSGNATGTQNPIIVTMDGDKTVTATFVAAPNTVTLEGNIGLWDGLRLWPVNGSETTVTACARPVLGGRCVPGNVAVVNDQLYYSIQGLQRNTHYNVTFTVSYFDHIIINNRFRCNRIWIGENTPGQNRERKESTLVFEGVNPTQEPTLDALFPIIVMVHGYASSYKKWYSKNDSNYWDNYARSKGFIVFTPNYYFHVDEQHTWELLATQVRGQIEINLKALSTSISNDEFPGWTYIAHSQGGLVARVLTFSEATRNLPSIRALQKIYELGTPNSGARSPGAALPCADFLSREAIISNFNLEYEDYGTTPVLAFAGENDEVVDDVDFVYRIIYPGLSYVELPHPDEAFPYDHGQLGSSESLPILQNYILPNIPLFGAASSRETNYSGYRSSSGWMWVTVRGPN